MFLKTFLTSTFDSTLVTLSKFRFCSKSRQEERLLFRWQIDVTEECWFGWFAWTAAASTAASRPAADSASIRFSLHLGKKAFSFTLHFAAALAETADQEQFFSIKFFFWLITLDVFFVTKNCRKALESVVISCALNENHWLEFVCQRSLSKVRDFFREIVEWQHFVTFSGRLDIDMTSRIEEDEAMDTSSPRGGSSSDDSSLVDEYNIWRQNDKNSIKLREVTWYICYVKFCNLSSQFSVDLGTC